jgi:uracil DNA glycosylase
VLTVRAGEPNSHKNQGWEQFTDAAIDALDRSKAPVVFVLWGAYAQKKGKRIKGEQHRIITGAHPSPLSAAKFLGSKPFSAINAALVEVGEAPLKWDIDDL